MKLEDTTIGWRFINPLMKAQYGVDAMPQTGDNVADDYEVSRASRTLRTAQSAAGGRRAGRGFFAEEIVEVRIAHKKGETVVSQDEHPRGDTRWKRWPNSNRSMVRTRPSPPATHRV